MDAKEIIGLLLALVITGVLSFRKIPSDHVAVITRFGQRTRETRGSGFNIFVPLVEGAILVPVNRIRYQMTTPEIRSRDSARMWIKIEIVWSVSEEDTLDFLDNGGVEGTQAMLQSVLSECLGAWAPTQDWRVMQEVGRRAATIVCIDALAGSAFKWSDFDSFLEGKAIPAKHGIVLHRLSIPEVASSPEIAHAAESRAIKMETLEADALEMATFSYWVKEVQRTHGCSHDVAVDVVQEQLGKIRRSVHDYRVAVKSGEGLSTAEVKALRRLMSGSA